MSATPPPPIAIDEPLLDVVTHAARLSPRLRRNHNFHTADTDACHRLLNGMEPGSYILPHRHLDPNKDETFVILRGAFGLVLFDDAGEVAQMLLLRAGGTTLGATVPSGTWHTLIAFEPGGVFLEAKAGPYLPLSDAERAPWAPAEGDAAAADYLEALTARFDA